MNSIKFYCPQKSVKKSTCQKNQKVWKRIKRNQDLQKYLSLGKVYKKWTGILPCLILTSFVVSSNQTS